MRVQIVAALSALCCCVATPALAQGYGQAPPPGGGYSAPPPVSGGDDYFGADGSLILSADRLFGFHSWNATVEIEDVDDDVEVSGTNVGLLISVPTTGFTDFTINPSAVPRLAIDFVVGAGVTLGGFFGFATGSSEQEQGDFKEDGPTITTIAVGPRVGYFASISDVIGIWPRLGFTYVSTTIETDLDPGTLETTTSLQNINLEAMLAITPNPSFAFLLGPIFDLGVGGSIENDVSGDGGEGGGNQPEINVTYNNFGVVAGIAGNF